MSSEMRFSIRFYPIAAIAVSMAMFFGKQYNAGKDHGFGTS